MNFGYAGLQTTAQRLIADFGRTATLVRPGEPTGPDYNPQPGTPTEYTVSLVQLEYSMTNRDQSLIQAGDRVWLVSTAGEAPAQTDTLKDMGKEYQLIDVQPLMPGDATLLFEVHGRA